MYNQQPKEPIKPLGIWQIAYAARELRQKKVVTLNCLKSEAQTVLEQLSSFSNSSPVMAKSSNKPNSKEIFLEIIDVI